MRTLDTSIAPYEQAYNYAFNTSSSVSPSAYATWHEQTYKSALDTPAHSVTFPVFAGLIAADAIKWSFRTQSFIAN